ncbi:MAG TPA: ABC transporter ATP-binding protein [Candidatus Binatia bacterium]|jgi:iron(III) transport system ATP-binding protein|nr:ABC transporter ATP-binding protein [Candidatus Binatia bacterium]
MAVVSIRELSKKFAEAAAVDNLDLEIGDGEFVSLLGPSGCGKTTTLRLLAGFLQPDAGEIRVGGEVVSSRSLLVPPERRQMSMIFQSYAIWPHMTVAQNVAYGLKFKKLARPEAEAKVTKLLSVVHLTEFRDRYAAELSGGQQQRVALARALVVEPQILLMDEPLSNLDANLREEMRFEIRRLHEEFKITTVYVTHDQAEAMATSDRIAVLDHGRLIQVGRPGEIFDRPKTRFVAEFVGKANILTGSYNGDGLLQLNDGTKIRVSGDGPAARSANAAVCLRPHNILLVSNDAAARQLRERGYNVFSGTIGRSIYFGDAVDYTIELPSQRSLRVIAPPSQRFDAGQQIHAAAHPEHCVVVRE